MLVGVAVECDERPGVWALFLETCTAVVDALDAHLQRQHGLPLSWFDVLAHLVAAPESKLRMNDLARSILLSKSGLTRLIDRMERAGLVTRSTCAEDRRVVHATLTPAGREVFRAAAPTVFGGVEQLFARHLTPAEERALTTACTKMLRATRRPDARAG